MGEEFEKDYMRELRAFLVSEKQAGKTLYPPMPDIFNAFEFTPFDQVKVVILGQDPYHGPGQAHGLCFSVQAGVRPPPSLKNIFKEINSELGIEFSENGCLTPWAEQGVLLLNSVLTVQQNNAGSHQGKGWEQFTDRAIQVLNEQHQGLVFLLWGKYAQDKAAVIDRSRHLVLASPHPSPFSAHRGFLGNGHFAQANDYLQAQGKTPINWCLD
ncbi:Uracil-DNA glycosylase2C family 1 [gamma proteobacterium IMCC2047]|nr:Uracil-DNA glycosylase2C family 1 [gamma proteobacterium IMCC2047]